MEIKILGTGCPKCRKLEMLVNKVVGNMAVEADIGKVETIPEIMAYGVAFTPALVIDGQVKCSGRLPKEAQLTTWIQKASGQ